MTKISEVIKYCESIKNEKEFDKYLMEPRLSSIKYTLSLIKEAIGDVELTEEYIKAYIYGFKSFPYKTPYERKIQKIRIIYELTKDTKMKPEDLSTLIDLYHRGTYSLMFAVIKELISTQTDIKEQLLLIKSEAFKYGKEEAKKLDYLKEEYGKEFIEKIQEIVQDECISSDKAIEILPSKTFIDYSITEVPVLGYTIKSGEDLVLKRLKSLRVEDDYQKTLPEEKIALGYCSSGDIVYTSFTKKEYEEELRSRKRIKRKK
ncbi:MAG: hypothetical protein VZS44_06925 [Bacilli bacterium]|nr:hypothetical protein [Bacilli bacterium]